MPVNVLLILEAAAGFFVGLMVWRMMVIGFQVGRLGRRFTVIPQSEHWDRCGGMGPVGNLCVMNAMIISVAGTFLGGWAVLGPFLPSNLYRCLADYWAVPFLSQLLVFLVLSGVAFFLPVWSIHQLMVARRTMVREQLDQLSQQISNRSRELLDRAGRIPADEGERMTKELELMRHTYQSHQHQEVWPFNLAMMVKLLIPQVATVVGVFSAMESLLG
ncbi:MAG: hypothetical protein FJ316_02700 [SAR202 cluster bacterium]|nr:hypothetical protein [SAR202 cluster bacterium]